MVRFLQNLGCCFYRDAKLHPTGVPVNSIDLHPSGNRILVHLRDNFIKILDAGTFIPLQTFAGLANERFQIQSCFSPCGNLVLSGSERNQLCIWDADTSKILKFLNPRNNIQCCVKSVDYHPFDYYMVAGLASKISEPSPILVYFYQPPIQMNYPLLRKTANKFKQSLEKNRSSQSMESVDSLVYQSHSGQYPTPVAKRGNSTEKFVKIIQKLDSALNLAQQSKKRRENEAKASSCAVPNIVVEDTNPNQVPPASAEKSPEQRRARGSISAPTTTSFSLREDLRERDLRKRTGYHFIPYAKESESRADTGTLSKKDIMKLKYPEMDVRPRSADLSNKELIKLKTSEASYRPKSATTTPSTRELQKRYRKLIGRDAKSVSDSEHSNSHRHQSFYESSGSDFDSGDHNDHDSYYYEKKTTLKTIKPKPKTPEKRTRGSNDDWSQTTNSESVTTKPPIPFKRTGRSKSNDQGIGVVN